MERFEPTEKELLREMRRVRRQKKRHRLAWGMLIWFALAAAGGWFVFNRYYTLAIVHGPGMNPSVLSGSVVLCRRMEEGQTPSRGDVVLFSKGREWQLKRVAALGGDQIALSSKGRLWINGSEWQGYESVDGMDDELRTHPITVPEGEMFVLGDEYSLSLDSRSSAYGTVPAEDAVGIMEYTIWPLYRITNPFQK